MAAGIEQAHGKVLVTMDGDLQNDPQDIAHFLAKIDEGYDIVVGWRFNRQDKLVSRKIPSKIANWIIGRVTGVPIKDNGCSLKAYRASLIKEIPLYSEMHRFIPAVASIAGPRIAEIKVRHHARQFGQSKYGLSRIYKVLLDLMVIKTVASFTARPLLWFCLLATPLALLGTTALTYAIWRLYATAGTLSLPIAGAGVVLLMGSFILIGGGVLGELTYKLGDMRERDFSRLTGRVWGSSSVGSPAGITIHE
jgi:glycosyltransferase involved in cell wall biosynthesis